MNIQTDLKLNYIEERLVSKGLIVKYDNIIDDENIQDTFKVSTTTPANSQALIYNDSLGLYEPQNVSVGTSLSNTITTGATILKGTTEIKRIDANPTSLIKISDSLNKVDIQLLPISTTTLNLLGHTPPAGVKEAVVIPLNALHFDTSLTTLSLNPINTTMISNNAVTTSKLANMAGVNNFLGSDSGSNITKSLGYTTPLLLNNNTLSLRHLRGLLNNSGPVTVVNISRSSIYYYITSNTTFNHIYEINTSPFDNTTISSLNEGYTFNILITNTHPTISPMFHFTHTQGINSSKLGLLMNNAWLSSSQQIAPLGTRLYKFMYINGTLPTTLNIIINTDIIELTT